MVKKKLVLISNEKIYKEKDKFYCDNLDLKILPEKLNENFDIEYIGRKAKKQGGQNIDLLNIKIASNFVHFIYLIIKSFEKNSKYIVVSITPYTFLACVILFIFRKKTYLYLRSDGHEEWKYILGKWSVWIFHLMYLICTSISEVIVCNKRLSKKKSHLISISRLDDSWFENIKEASLEKIKFLYVGRMSPEKGIFDFLNLFNKINLDANLSIVGYSKDHTVSNDNVKFLGYFSKPDLLMKAYDENNITILPSYTEGYPYVIDESLSRKRPVIIFEEISYVVNEKRGIFIAKRELNSLRTIVNYIIENYAKIQKEMDENKLPTKKSMIRQISNIINN
tara:strand:+ start:431 stop:1441 length:1011 start_codon:yes stop_codon:yes gene_type:complete